MQLEEWLSSITRIGLVSGEGEGGGDASALAGLVEQTALQIETLKDVVLRGEEARQKTDASLEQLAGSSTTMTHALGARAAPGSGIASDGDALASLAQSQTDIAEILRKREEETGLLDSEARARLRNI